MNKKIQMSLVVVCLVIAGCQTHHKSNEYGTSLFTWKSNISAAIVKDQDQFGHSKACLQYALSMRDTSVDVDAL